MSVAVTMPRDALQLPLDGIRAVEASAGTGKTFTIATLHLRLILERGLGVDEIVVATFTRAAAAELSERLRERVAIADALLAGGDPATPVPGDDGEHAETRKVIRQALDTGVDLATLQARARDARLAIDTAFIGTLHGFCHRALAEFGFDTGQSLAQPELIEDIRELETEIVRDFWRRGSADVATATLLANVWKAPEQLAQQACDPRWRGREVEVPAADMDSTLAAFEDARTRIAAWPPATVAAAADELQRCIKDTRARNSRLAALQALQHWACAGAAQDTAADLDSKAAESLLADNIAALKPDDASPEGDAFDDVGALLQAFGNLQIARTAAAGLPAARMLQDAREFLDHERPQRLAERNLMGHDEAVDRLATALADDERGARAAARIRVRWKAALVDEFQDTDPRQWRVVQSLFADTSLVLVGDPKQAIYGFRGGDVFAWLDARAHAEGEPLQLTDSWRSGAGLCAAINALFSRTGAFVEAGIEHPDIQPAVAVAQRALLQDGEPLPALEIWRLDPEVIGHAPGRPPSKKHAYAAIERACVGWIVDKLRDPRIRLRDQHGVAQALHPKHIAVLVNSNAEAHALQAALARAGVPASCNLRASVYASDEAADLALLLDALAAPDDVRRARAARASRLVGDDAASIAAGREDAPRQAAWLEGIAGWAMAVRQHGLLAWLHRMLADAAPRVLALPEGQRRIANYLQLAELLQDLHAASFGVADLAARFARARVEAHDDADTARLRLDTDADAVTIATVHAAKGLEYDVVLLPYAVLGREPYRKQQQRPPQWWYHAGNAARVALGTAASDAVQAQAIEEVHAEEVRKLYVAVTRASALCVLPYGATSATCFSAAYRLLHVAGREQALSADAAGCEAAVHELAARAPDAVRMVDLPAAATARHSPAAPASADLHARTFARGDLQRDWRIWSFSRLVRGSGNHAAADPRPGAGDADAIVAQDAGPAGPAFGTAVHAVFEQTDFAAWRDAPGIPEAERALVERSLRDGGVGSAGAIELTGACVRAALNASLPCGVRLCDVAADARKAEVEFHLSLAPAQSSRLFALLHAHGYQRQRSGVAPECLHGLMTGKIDLTFVHAGRFHIIDWKTNRCAPYDDAAMRAEIAAHDYDLQWLVYTLALHRWLRQQLPDYDYDRHVGEVYYLFVRGMGDGGGIHVDRPPRALIEALDALFDVPAGATA